MVAKALAKSPDDRYATCRDLSTGARAALRASPRAGAPTVAAGAAPTVVDPARTVADRPPAAETTVEPVRRPWWRSPAALIAAAVIVLAGAGAGIGIALSGGGGGGETGAAASTGTGATSGTATGETATGATPVTDDGEGVLVFSSQRDGDFDIYASALDSSGRVLLTPGASDEGGPRFSPDGSQIVYYGNEGGDFEIYVMDSDGGNVTQLTDNDVADLYPSWSRDGTKIAFTEEVDGDAEVFAMNADGSEQTQLTENDVEDRYPTWSPDGTEIAFSTAATGGYEIALMNADGSDVRSLTDNEADDDAPDWSPDRSLLVFSSNRNGGNFDIWTMTPEGDDPSRLATASREDAIPRWVGDGSRIVFDSNRDGDFEIFLMNADGSGQTQLTDDLTPDYEPDISLTATLPTAGSTGGVPRRSEGVSDRAGGASPVVDTADDESDVPARGRRRPRAARRGGRGLHERQGHRVLRPVPDEGRHGCVLQPALARFRSVARFGHLRPGRDGRDAVERRRSRQGAPPLLRVEPGERRARVDARRPQHRRFRRQAGRQSGRAREMVERPELGADRMSDASRGMHRHVVLDRTRLIP